MHKKSLTPTKPGSDGNTSFLRAARAGHLDKVLEHLKSNIDINTSNANGLNALHLASKDGHVDVVAELLKRGATVDAATKKGNTALHIASLAGQEEVVKLLVNHGASVNVQSQNGFTPLYMAAQENHDNVVKYLLANGANQSLATEDGFTPLAVAMQQGHDKVVTVLLENDTRGKVRLPALHIAAKKDDVKAAKLLLENDHNPDVTSKSGFTPLHIASHYGNESIANLLIQKKADVNYAAKHNITPLHVAAKWGKTNMVALLLEKGANIESKTRDGLTPLHCAARSGHEQVVDMLLEREAPISCKTKNGLAPLHMAAQGDHVDAARILLYHRAPVDEVTVDYLTALHVAAHCGHVRVAKLLLDRQADANARALNGFTPLHIACKKNRIKVVELLLKHGASISATTESGLTPLHVASFMGCMNIVIYLLQHDANPDVPTVRGETPLHLAARANQTDIIRILLRNGAQVDARAREQQTPLHIASRLGNVDIVMLLLQHGAKVDTTTKDMYTALHIAAKEGQDEVAGVLIENGASLNATTKKGFTPLHLAAKYGNIKVAKLLLQKEAPVDAQGKNGVTPLHVASHYDHQNVALLLLDKGASPHATAKNGHTPLHIAAKKNQMDIANTLLEYGAKPSAESKAGFTPLHLSAQEGHTDMSSLLIEHEADTNHQAKNGLTPLHLCAQEDRVPVAEILVKNGAVVDKTTKAGYTPLHVACHYGQNNMVKFLLSNGADVKSTTSIGYTPLHQAAQQGHTNVVNVLLENKAQPNAITNNGQTPLNIAQKLGYITVIETLKLVTDPVTTHPTIEEKYKVVAPEAMHETFMSDSEEEGGEDTMLGDNVYRYLTADEMKSLGDDSLPIDVTRDERIDSNKMVTSSDINMLPPQAIEDSISPQHIQNNYSEYIKKYTPDNVDIARHPISIGFLVSFLVDARGGAMRGCRHSGVRVIVPPRSAGSPTRITCRYVRPQRTPHPPPLMEGEALASRVLELGPVGAKFLGPVIIEVPHFAALRGKEREIVILRSDNGETWREHTVDSSEEILNEVLNESFEAEDINQMEDTASGRITRILTTDFPQYFAVVSRIRQEVHAIGPEGGMVSSTVVPQVQAVFPQGALTKKIKVGLQAQPIDPELTAKLLGHGVAVSPVVTVEPRRRKFHKAITLSMPAPRAHSQGMINQYSGSTPTLRLLCSITGGTTRAQWEDVTGSTPLTFVNDCVSFTTTVSARFWLMDCRNVGDATKMATELYREAIHVPFMAKFVVFAKRIDPLEARLRVFCMTDDKEDKTLEHQEHFTEVAKSRDVEVLEGKPQYIEFAGNLVPITKSGEQLQFAFRAFRENRLPFSVRVKDQHAEAIGRSLFMREPKVPKGEPPQQPICILNIVLPDDIVADTISLTDSEQMKRHEFLKDGYDYYRPDPRLADMSNLLGEDWVPLATHLGLTSSEINVIKSEYPDSVAKQAQSMLRMWISQSTNRSQGDVLENALRRIGREDIIPQCLNEQQEMMKKEEHIKYKTKEEVILEDRDFMKDSESIESLVQAERKEERSKKRGSYDKYSAEEKVVEEPSDEEDYNRTVTERREMIEKRLSVDRTIPASSQRAEIVQEISSIKRQSLVEDKIAEVEREKKLSPPEDKEAVVVEEVIEEKTTTITTVKPSPTTEVQPSENVTMQDVPVEKTTITTTTTTTIEKETRTTQDGTDTMYKPEKIDKVDTGLIAGVTQKLETKRVVPILSADEDPKSPKVSKTPPPSPADFILREKATTVQEWEAKGKSGQPAVEPEGSLKEIDDKEISSVPLIQTSAEITVIPQPKPRSTTATTTAITTLTNTTDNQTEMTKVDDDFREQIVDSKEFNDVDSPSSESIIEHYSERKKFWENVSKESTLEVKSKSKILPMKRTPSQEVPTQPPVPKPRSTIQTAPSLTDCKDTEEALPKPMSEYKSAYQDPTPKSTEELGGTIEHTDSLDSDNENSCQINLSSGYDNTGYISDSGDVEHYISDSEIEDRVPQIRERQMSVFQPTTITSRRTIYERSCSLPTEDLYEVSAKSIMLRKQYFEEQIKKEMVEDVLMTEIEEEPSPEHKTLGLATLESKEELSGIKSVPENIHFDIEESFIPKRTERLSSKDDLGEALILDDDYDVKVDSLHKDNESMIRSLSKQEDLFENLKDDLSSKPGDSLEVHVDKSEIEDSEKMTDLDATDLEISPKTLYQPEQIPEITISLSEKQRRISEDSEKSFEKATEIESPIVERSETTSPICQPEEHIQDTIWEVPVQLQSQPFEESTLEIHHEHQIFADKDDELSSSVRDESDLGSEIHQDHSESCSSDRRSESQADIEKIILESLHHQKISPEEAKLIASELIADIEAEIHRRHSLEYDAPPAPEYARNQVSDYLRQLAEAKGLDSREVQLVQSVLARKQRELAKLSRGDTQASSIEITDEDLKYSGTDYSPTASRANILEEQIDHLEAEKVLDPTLDEVLSRELIDEKFRKEIIISKDNETLENEKIVHITSHLESTEENSITGEKLSKETKDIIMEEDETLIDSLSEDTEHMVQKTEAILKQKEDIHTEDFIDSTTYSTIVSQENVHDNKIVTQTEILITDDKIESKVKTQFLDEISERIAGTYEIKEDSKTVLDDEIVEKQKFSLQQVTGFQEKTSAENAHYQEVVTMKDDIETTKQETKVSVSEKSESTVFDTCHLESVTSTTTTHVVTEDDLEKLLADEKTREETHEVIERTLSDESKSSQEEFKSPEEFTSSYSSERKEVVYRKQKPAKDDTSSSSSNLKPDRRSGVEFEIYSSSGESHYHSFEIDSGKSRPCSSDIDALIAAGSSEYESALTSQDASVKSYLTSTEYHTAVSSLSSKESMKSLDSESSGHLGSIEISEASETLVPSELGGELDQNLEDDLSFDRPNAPTRQSTELSESDGIPIDTQQSIDISEEDFLNESSDIIETTSKMKRSQEMTFQPEPKTLVPDSPQYETEERLGTSLEDGSVLSMSLSSTSSLAAQRTVIELSHTESDRAMTFSNTSEQFSIDDPDHKSSRESLVHIPTLTSEMSTCTPSQDFKVDTVTLTTSSVEENGIPSVGTQVVSQSHTPEGEKSMEDFLIKLQQESQPEVPEPKKRGHRRNESTTFIPSMIPQLDKQVLYNMKDDMSVKEVKNDEKKDIDELEKEDLPELSSSLAEKLKDDVQEQGFDTKAGSEVDITDEKLFLDELVQIKNSLKEKPQLLDKHTRSGSTSSEKSSFEEAEAEAAFSMVAHVSPVHKIKQICTIMEDEDAEKHELETREKAKKEFELRRQQMKEQSPGSIPDIKVTQHMTPMDRKGFQYPDLELEEKEEEAAQKSTPQTPASNSSKSSESTDQGREYVLDESEVSIPEESESQIIDEKTSEITTVIEKTVVYETDKDTASPTESPNSDSFEMLEKPDLIDEFVVIEEVGKEAHETDMEGKSVKISKGKTVKKHDEEVEEYLVKSAPSPSTKMTNIKYYPDGSSSDELGFEFEDSPPLANQKNAGTTAKTGSSPRDYVYEYDRELEANKKWIEQQFQGDHAAMMAAGYGYEMEFERCPLEDIKEEDANDFDSSRIGSLNSQKESGGSLGSVKDSYSSTPEYDVLAGRRYFTKSGDHDDISMSSLQEFENLERAMSLENRKFHQGSQDSSSNGSFKTRYFGRSGQGDDVSVSSLKEFEGLEKACIAAHKVEIKAKEEELLLAQIDEGQESLASESESCETVTGTDKKIADSDEEDYEKRLFEIDEIIRQAQTNVERFIDLKEVERTESIGRGDSVEEVSKIPDLDLDVPIQRPSKIQWGESEDVLLASADSLETKEIVSCHGSADSLDQKTALDVMTASTDSIEFQIQKSKVADSLETRPMTSSDSLELATANIVGFSDSIDEDGSRIGGCDQSSSSTGKDVSSSTKEDELVDQSKTLGDYLLESTDSIASTSTATHATYQYETDSVFSGSFTSGGSNTMVSSTDNIDPAARESVNLAEAVRRVWFDEDDESSESKPYVTEVIEPGETEITRYTFEGPGSDQQMKEFIDSFKEGEEVFEEKTTDASGNVHIKRTVKKKIIIQEKSVSPPITEGVVKRTYIDDKGTKTIYMQRFEHTDDTSAAVHSLLTSIAGDSSGEASVSWQQVPADRSGQEKDEKEEAEVTTQGSPRPTDQHQLSEEMKELLKDMEKESKK